MIRFGGYTTWKNHGMLYRWLAAAVVACLIITPIYCRARNDPAEKHHRIYCEPPWGQDLAAGIDLARPFASGEQRPE